MHINVNGLFGDGKARKFYWDILEIVSQTRSGWMEVSLLFVKSKFEHQILLRSQTSAEDRKISAEQRALNVEGHKKEMSDDNQELPTSLLSKHTHRKHTLARAHTHRSTNR